MSCKKENICTFLQTFNRQRNEVKNKQSNKEAKIMTAEKNRMCADLCKTVLTNKSRFSTVLFPSETKWHTFQGNVKKSPISKQIKRQICFNDAAQVHVTERDWSFCFVLMVWCWWSVINLSSIKTSLFFKEGDFPGEFTSDCNLVVISKSGKILNEKKQKTLVPAN